MRGGRHTISKNLRQKGLDIKEEEKVNGLRFTQTPFTLEENKPAAYPVNAKNEEQEKTSGG